MAGLECVTTGSVVSALPYRATQVDKSCKDKRQTLQTGQIVLSYRGPAKRSDSLLAL